MHRLVIALVTFISLIGVTVVGGYLLLFSTATDRASALAPANTAAYASIYLQPSAQQQMNLSELIGRLPGFADEAALDDKIDQIVQNLLGQTGIDYRTQVKPWLGDQVAIAAWPNADDLTQSSAVVMAEVADAEAARAAVADIVAESDTAPEATTYEGVQIDAGTGSAWAIVGEMLVVGPTAESLHPVIDVHGGASSLAAQPEFIEAMDRLPPDHLAALFIDLEGVVEAAGLADDVGVVTTLSATLSAEQDGLRLSGSVPFDLTQAAPSARETFALGGEPSSLVNWMPEDTMVEAVVFGLRQMLETAEEAAGGVPEADEVSGALDSLRAIAAFGLGIDIDADLLPLLDREVALSITGFDGGMPSGQLLLRPDDISAADESLGRVAESLETIGAAITRDEVDGITIVIADLPEIGEVAYAVVDDLVILGLSTGDVLAAIDAHANGTSLGTSDRYATTFEVAGTRGGSEVWADIGPLMEVGGSMIDIPDDARDILASLGTFGLTVPSRHDQIEFHAVLTVDER